MFFPCSACSFSSVFDITCLTWVNIWILAAGIGMDENRTNVHRYNAVSDCTIVLMTEIKMGNAMRLRNHSKFTDGDRYTVV